MAADQVRTRRSGVVSLAAGPAAGIGLLVATCSGAAALSIRGPW